MPCSGVGGATEIVRDVFVAADLMHEDAMSQMGGDENDDNEGVARVEVGVAEHTGTNTEACGDQEGTEVGSDEGQGWVHGMFCANVIWVHGMLTANAF